MSRESEAIRPREAERTASPGGTPQGTPNTTPSASPGGDALDLARRAVLGYLEHAGPSALAEIPARWPLTRHHLRLIAAGLARDGLVRILDDDGDVPPRVSLTPAGLAMLPGDAAPTPREPSPGTDAGNDDATPLWTAADGGPPAAGRDAPEHRRAG